MRILYLLLLFFLLAFLESCALFQKTSKRTTTDKQSSQKQLESSQLLFKTANKETQIVTYWNDSGFYQVQNIREQIDLAKSDRFKREEKQVVKQETIVKKTEPVKIWIYTVIVIGVVGCYMIIRKFL